MIRPYVDAHARRNGDKMVALPIVIVMASCDSV